MALEDFFDHTCDIYHIQAVSDSPGYGLPDSGAKYVYGTTPDVSAQKCHFGVKSAGITIIQKEPYNDMSARIKLTLPKDADIRINDKIIDCDTGYEYTAEAPRNIRGHHIFAYIKRVENQRAL